MRSFCLVLSLLIVFFFIPTHANSFSNNTALFDFDPPQDDFYICVRQPMNMYVTANDGPNNPGMNDLGWRFVQLTQHGGVIADFGNHYVSYNPTNSPTPFYGLDTFTYSFMTNGGPPYSSDATVFIAVIPLDDAQNAGRCLAPPIPSPNMGMPVNASNGNMWLEERDYILPGPGDPIEINRFYNSVIKRSGLFGLGWSTKYDESLEFYDDGNKMVRFNAPDGRASYFVRANTNDPNDPFKSISQGMVGKIVKDTSDNSYTLTFKDGRVHHFDSTGKLRWQEDRNANRTTLNYTGTVLTSITDSVQRTLTITIPTGPGTNGKVSQITDTMGWVAMYEYWAVSGVLTDRLKTVTYRDGSKHEFEYKSAVVASEQRYFLETVKDALGNILEHHEYDGLGRATTSEKQGGIDKYTFAFGQSDVDGTHTRVTDAHGNITRFYFRQPQLWGTNLIRKIKGTGSCGSCAEVTEYTYDETYSWLNLTQKKEVVDSQTNPPTVYTTNYTYDANRNVTEIRDVLGRQTFSEYNIFGQAKYHTDRMGGLTTNIYDTAGNLESSTVTNSIGTVVGKVTFTYWPLRKQLATITDGLNNQPTKFFYDNYGRMTLVKDAYKKNTVYEYNDRAQVTSVANALEQVTSYGYDDNNRLNNITYFDESYVETGQVNIVYDLAGRVTSITDENGHPTTYGYDEAYRLTSIADAINPPTIFGYDSMSNLTSQTDALGNVTNYEYDDFNRLSKIIYPEVSSSTTRLEESFAYTSLGELELYTDTAGRETSYVYAYSPFPTPSQSPSATPTPSLMKRVITITDANNKITELTYNARMQMTKVKDARPAPNVQEYTFEYDQLGRMLFENRNGATFKSYLYDAEGNRTKRTDANGNETIYTYDMLNRLTNISYTGDTSQNGAYGYDDLSRLVLASNQSGPFPVRFTYDNRGRVTSERDVYDHLMEYSYDPAGNRLGLTLDGNPHASYIYDDANNLTRLTDEANQNFNFYYDEAKRLTSIERPNNVLTTYQYDGMSRLESLTHEQGAILYNDQFIYNSANQIHQIKPLGTSKRIYGYDFLNRLTSVTVGGSESYTYDEVGNRLSSLGGTSYSAGAFNRLLSTTSPTANYGYNNNGSRTSKTGGGPATSASYGWDRENRLTSVTRLGMAASNSYDALGRRVATTFSSGLEDDELIRFTYDGQDVLYEDSDAWQGSSIKYQNGPGIDNKLKSTTDGTPNYFLQDHLGSTVKLTNSSGGVTATNSYDSFGRPTNSSFPTRYQFTGREYDSFSSLQYSRARFYDPQIGRFISEDPIGFGGGDVNLYGYVRNNPLRFRDPTGLQIPGPNPGPTPPKPQRSCDCSPPGTLQIGPSVLGIFGPGAGFAGQLGAGVAIDGSGNIVAYTDYGPGAGVGASVSGAVNVNVSNAPTVYELTETFNSLNVNGGAGYDAGLNAFANPDFSVVGGGFSLGVGAGAGGSLTQTWTDLHGGFNIWDVAGIRRPMEVCR